jgi:hypothetical protein
MMQGWMKGLLSEIEEAVREEAARGGTHLAAKKVGRFEARYQELIEAGLEANPLHERMGKRRRLKPNEGQ